MVESDEEQLEVLKKWWDENGTSLVITVVLAVGGSMGYRAWENNVQQTGEAASATFENMVSAVQNAQPTVDGDPMTQTARNLGENLKTEYGGTTYAVFASLHLAKLAVDADDLDTAESELRWVLEQDIDRRLESIARTRLARVLQANGDATAALAQLLNFEPAAGQVSSYEEVKGDVMLAIGDQQGAREAYQRAINAMDEDVSKPLLEVKLADLPLPGTDPGTDVEAAEGDA